MMMRGLVVAALVVAAQAAAPFMKASLLHGPRHRRDTVSPITVSLYTINENDGKQIAEESIAEGRKIVVKFALNADPKLSCASDDCMVRIVLENQRPDEVSLSKCYLEWHTSDPEWCCAENPEHCELPLGDPLRKMCKSWQQAKEIEISTVEDFVDDGEQEVIIKTNAIESESERFTGLDLPEIRIQTPDKGSAECSSTSDPNYRQFDGGVYTVNDQGTYELWNAPLRNWQVQTRVNQLGANCAVAIRENCDVIVFDRCNSNGVMTVKKRFDETTDPAEQMKVTREGNDGSTWIVTSQLTGARVKMTQRIVHQIPGDRRCGWSGCNGPRGGRPPCRPDERCSGCSGCRIITRAQPPRYWLDVFATAPGEDFGWVDTLENKQTTPRVTGLCGHWTNKRDDDIDQTDAATGKKITPTNYANRHKVQGKSLFQETPAKGICDKNPPPVPADPKECSIKPRHVQKPVIRAFDIELITDLIKNQVLKPGEVDEDLDYEWPEEQFLPPARTPEELEVFREFCQYAIVETPFTQECLKMTTYVTRPDGEKEKVQVQEKVQNFVDMCVTDLIWQGTEDKDAYASASFEALKEYCVETRAKSPDFANTCDAGKDCDVWSGRCVGDCSLIPSGDLETMVKDKCPNSCGLNARTLGSGGDCLQNEDGINYCRCYNPKHWGGADCTVRIGGRTPSLKTLEPIGCATNKGEECKHVVVHASVKDNTLFGQGRGIKCMVESQLTTGTLIDQTQIRCDLPTRQHSGADAHFVKVAVTTDFEDAKTWSEFLYYCYHDSACVTCDQLEGTTTVNDGTCAVANKCYKEGDVPTGPFDVCKVCDPDYSKVEFKYDYSHKDCKPEVDVGPGKFEVMETLLTNSPINVDSPLRAKMNMFTQHDSLNKATFRLVGQSDMFKVEPDTGLIVLIGELDYERKPKEYTLQVEIEQGGQTDSKQITIAVQDAEEAAEWNTPAGGKFAFEIEENQPAQQLQGKLCWTSEDETDSELTLSVQAEGGKQDAPFSIEKVPGEDCARLSTTRSLNHEKTAEWTLAVRGTTPGGSVTQTEAVITVRDGPDGPTFIKLDKAAVDEGSPKGTVISKISVMDDDVADTRFDMELEGGDGWLGLIETAGTWELVVAKDGLDYDSMVGSKWLAFNLTATDSAGLPFMMKLHVKVTAVNDPPYDIKLIKMANDDGSDYQPKPLDELSENAPVGPPLGYFTSKDDDSIGTPTTYELAPPVPGFEIDGTTLKLTKPLNYEAFADGKAEVTFSVVASDESATSKPQQFTIKVLDAPDLPKFFQWEGAQPTVEEMSPVDKIVGVVSAIDEDAGDEFDFKVDATSGFKVGSTTCEPFEGGMKCRAQVSISANKILDFESNRIDAVTAEVPVPITAVPRNGEAQVRCQLGECPAVAVADTNDRPTGVKTDQAAEAESKVIEVYEGSRIVAPLFAADADDYCPAELEGCATVSTARSSFALAMKSQSDRFVLSSDCSRQLSAQQRVVESKLCMLKVKPGAAELTEGENVPVTLLLTDKFDDDVQPSMEVVVNIKVIAAAVKVDLVNMDNTGSLDEIAQLFARPQLDRFLPVGQVKISGWPFAGSVLEKPPVVIGALADAIRIEAEDGETRRRRVYDNTREFFYYLKVDHDLLDKEDDLEFQINVPAQGSFEGMTSDAFKLPVVGYTRETDGTRVCNVNGVCHWARIPDGELVRNADVSQYEISSVLSVSAHAPKGTVVGTLAKYAAASKKLSTDELEYEFRWLLNDKGGTDKLLRNLFDLKVSGDGKTQIVTKRTLNTGMLANTFEDDFESNYLLTLVGSADGKVADVFKVDVELDWCGEGIKCSTANTRRCEVSGEQSPYYKCSCDQGWAGDFCTQKIDEVVLAAAPESGDSDDIVAASGDDKDGKSGLSIGAIVGIVLAVLILMIVVIAVVLYVKHQQSEDQRKLDEIRMHTYVTRTSSVSGANPRQFQAGVANEAFPWYDPSAEKQAVYEELGGSSQAGDFKIRDAGGPMDNPIYHIHVKTPKMLVKDATIETVYYDGDPQPHVRLQEGTGSAPVFAGVPALVEHYASVDNVDAPFKLRLDNPMYFTGQEGLEIYDNAAVKNEVVLENDAPNLPSKSTV
jgi:hypothetical protein